MKSGAPKTRHYYRKYALISEEGEIFLSCSGEFAVSVANAFVPSPDEIRRMLWELRERWAWPQALLAGVLGVPTATLRRWEDASRNPCGAARRLIWLIHGTCVREEPFVNLFDIVSWGRGDKREIVIEG